MLRRRTVLSDGGGVIENGPFSVILRNFTLTYVEGDQKITIPVEVMLRGHCEIGTTWIRCWDNSDTAFSVNQIFTIKQNIFSALDFMKVHNTNPR